MCICRVCKDYWQKKHKLARFMCILVCVCINCVYIYMNLCMLWGVYVVYTICIYFLYVYTYPFIYLFIYSFFN